MSGNPALGQFLMAEDIHQAATFANLALSKLTEHDIEMIEKIIEQNWLGEEQMVSNLLQFPQLISENLRVATLLRALEDEEMPYYTLSAAVGFQSLTLDEKQLELVIAHLKKAVFSDYGVVSMVVFSSLLSHLSFPKDIDIFIDILQSKKYSTLHKNATSWLVVNTKDKDELMKISEQIPDELAVDLLKKFNLHCKAFSHGEASPVTVEVFDLIPNLNDFDAMTEKEDALSDFFDDLTNKNEETLSPETVKEFLEDIGSSISMESLIKEMKNIGVDDKNRIDKDGFIELMFPKFKC